MQIKVSDIITIPYLRDCHIINSKNYSDNLVGNIEVIDNIGITPITNNLYILNNNLLINEEESLIDFVKLCSTNLVSAIIINEKNVFNINKLKSFITNIHINTPIIITTEDIYSLNIAFYIQSYISEFYKSELNKIIDVNNSFSRISLKTPDIKLIINYFKTVINNPVVMYDEFFNIIECTDNYLSEYDEVPGTCEKNFLYNLYFNKQNVIFKNNDVPVKECIRVLFPVTFENRDKAYLAVFEVNSPLSCVDYTILEICATATLMEMKRILAIKKIEEKYLNDLLYDLIFRKDIKIDEIKHRAKLFNIKENADYCFIIFDLNFNDIYKHQKLDIYEEDIEKISNTIISYIKNNYKQSVVSKFGKSILLLHKVNCKINESYSDIKEMCNKAIQIFIEKYEFMYIQIGIGSIINNLSDISKSYHESLSSISYGRTIYGDIDNFVIMYNDSIMLKIFSNIKDKELLYDMIPENLLILKKHDNDSKSNLIETLSIYLDSNCNAKKASEKMFIHYKTIQYRLEKIFKDYNIDIESSHSRLQIELGIQILNIMDIQNKSEHISL